MDKIKTNDIVKICKEKYQLGVVINPLYGDTSLKFTSTGIINVLSDSISDINICVVTMEDANTENNNVTVFCSDRGYAKIESNSNTISNIEKSIEIIEKYLKD